MIRFDGVSKRYPGGHVGLEHVSFHLERGEIAFLTGHSGAGKSTLMKLIMLLERASAGQVWVGGHNLRALKNSRIPYLRRNIGVVFQDHQLLFDRTVFENVALPLLIAGYSPSDCAGRVRAALDMVGLLSKEKLLPVALSGGEQQRVGLARAVVNRPALILADEPTGNLDPQLSTEIMKLFENFNQVGVTVLIASHDLALVARMRHRILTLEHGRLVADQEVQ
ncbi:cell division ATP-binding protein FtsE [Endozoicomonas sp. GU-1]|uniref:cell division ATP-binding protein FtsE n=1 Tax=Endozoicomonas sp. GU-1 TaxID=3009078 RepID=UPI0022B32047|nr:cell division ATP-binding protein FtsE [Endozoicomonas sp. GU-1]WBA82576.1 cell division ATP-binding protein FtsE [Endozoicomonas sp. GU-1]WBA85505.1 cell division ATP-binding protein FtsE [Endozoicomonas sp. GU-1]